MNSVIPQSARQAAGPIVAAMLALLASLALATAQAEASCGDYVMIGSLDARDSHPAAAGRAHHADDAAGQTPGPSVPRCHGPLCANGSIPPASPSPRVEMTAEQWALSAGMTLMVPPDGHSFFTDARVLAHDGFGLSILRPPR